MRLIDADVLRMSIEKDRDASDMPKMWYEGIAYAINHIIHAPTTDAVEVVRCRDCKHRNGSACDYSAVWVRENGFCQWGERSEDE